VIASVRESVLTDLKQMNYDISGLTGATVLGAEGLGLDSLAASELAVRIEDAYGVRFSDEELEGLAGATLDEFVTVVASRIDPAVAVSQAE
jgi:acyl carrier protein